MKILRQWKKVFENDMDYIVSEMKEVIMPPSVLILTGPVGAGKTTFVKRFMKIFPGASASGAPARAHEYEVLSPTYSVINESGNMAHADFYRIKEKEELVHLELSLYLENKDFFVVEWGKPFLSFLKREIDEKFKFYELEILMNGSGAENRSSESQDNSSRNYILSEI